jgi:hypothetical protein
LPIANRGRGFRRSRTGPATQGSSFAECGSIESQKVASRNRGWARALDPAAQVRMRPQRQAIGLVGAAGTGEQRDIGNGVRVAGNEVAPRELCI